LSTGNPLGVAGKTDSDTKKSISNIGLPQGSVPQAKN
jgi:hypothetical protein